MNTVSNQQISAATRHPRFVEPLDELAAMRAGVAGEGPLPPFYFETRDALGRQNSFRFDQRLLRAGAGAGGHAAGQGLRNGRPRWLRINTNSGIPTPPDSEAEEEAADAGNGINALLDHVRESLVRVTENPRRRRREADDDGSDSDLEIVLDNPDARIPRARRAISTRDRLGRGVRARSYHWPPTPYVSARQFDDEEDYFADAFAGMRITPPMAQSEPIDEVEDTSVKARIEPLAAGSAAVDDTSPHLQLDNTSTATTDLAMPAASAIEVDTTAQPQDERSEMIEQDGFLADDEDEDRDMEDQELEPLRIELDRRASGQEVNTLRAQIAADWEGWSIGPEVDLLPLSIFPSPTLDSALFSDATAARRADGQDVSERLPAASDAAPQCAKGVFGIDSELSVQRSATRISQRPGLLDGCLDLASESMATTPTKHVEAACCQPPGCLSDTSDPSSPADVQRSSCERKSWRYDFSQLDDATIEHRVGRITYRDLHGEDSIAVAEGTGVSGGRTQARDVQRTRSTRAHMLRARDGHFVSPYPLCDTHLDPGLRFTRLNLDSGSISPHASEVVDDYFSIPLRRQV